MNKYFIKKDPYFSVILPFKRNGDIDYKVHFKYLDFFYKNGVRNFYLMLYNSRLGLLNENESLEVNNRTANYLKKKYKKKVYFIGAEKFEGSADETLDRIKKLNKNVDAFSIIFGEKFYNENQVYNYFKYINRKTSKDLLFHMQMMMNGHGIDPPIVNYSSNLVQKICRLNKIKFIKEDAKIHRLTLNIIKKVKNNSIIIKSGGGMSVWKNYKKYGCHTWLVGIELLNPKLAFDFLQNLKNKKFLKNLEEKIEKPFFSEVKKYGWHIFLKACLEYMNLMKRYERLPLQEVNSKEYKKICIFMKKLRHNSIKYLGYDYFKPVK